MKARLIRLRLAVGLFAATSWCAGADPVCAEIPGADQVLGRSGLRFLLAGEMHGTNEGPEIFGDLVCIAGQGKRAIAVGIERPGGEQGAIDAFLDAADHEAARAALLSHKGWHVLDGRSSEAMLALLEKLRGLKRQGRIQAVIALDDSRPGDSSAQREERMAARLTEAASERPGGLVMALTGNVHASRKAIAEIGTYPLMGMLLPAGETLSLWIADQGGEAWTQMDGECGPHPFGASGGARRGVTLSRGEGILAGYDGLLSTGARVTPSLPAGKLRAPRACSADDAGRTK